MKILIMGGTPTFQVRVRIQGSFRGKKFTYEDPADSDGSQFFSVTDSEEIDCSEYWWTDGNLGCDCNRRRFLPEGMRKQLAEDGCSDEILIDSITPIEAFVFPTLHLDESKL